MNSFIPLILGGSLAPAAERIFCKSTHAAPYIKIEFRRILTAYLKNDVDSREEKYEASHSAKVLPRSLILARG